MVVGDVGLALGAPQDAVVVVDVEDREVIESRVLEGVDARSEIGGYCAAVSMVRGMLNNQDRGL